LQLFDYAEGIKKRRLWSVQEKEYRQLGTWASSKLPMQAMMLQFAVFWGKGPLPRQQRQDLSKPPRPDGSVQASGPELVI
jgi:hypothetical protein